MKPFLVSKAPKPDFETRSGRHSEGRSWRCLLLVIMCSCSGRTQEQMCNWDMNLIDLEDISMEPLDAEIPASTAEEAARWWPEGELHAQSGESAMRHANLHAFVDAGLSFYADAVTNTSRVKSEAKSSCHGTGDLPLAGDLTLSFAYQWSESLEYFGTEITPLPWPDMALSYDGAEILIITYTNEDALPVTVTYTVSPTE